MFVVNDQGHSARPSGVTYAHEFNHALQDQHFDLNRGAQAPDQQRSIASPRTRVVEGDAVLLQTLWAATNLTQDELIELARRQPAATIAWPACRWWFAPSCYFRTRRLQLRSPGVPPRPATATRASTRCSGTRPSRPRRSCTPTSTATAVHPVDVPLPRRHRDPGSLTGGAVGSGVLGELDTRVVARTVDGDRSRCRRGWRPAGPATAGSWSKRTAASAIVVEVDLGVSDAARAASSAPMRAACARVSTRRATDEYIAARQALTTPVSATDLRLAG